MRLRNLQTQYLFRVTIPGLSDISFRCQKVTTPEKVHNKRTHSEFGHAVKLPADSTIDGTLTFEMLVPNLKADLSLWKLATEVRNPTTKLFGMPSEVFKTIIVEDLNEKGVTIRRVLYTDCFVIKHKMGDKDAAGSDNQIDSLEFEVNDMMALPL